MCINSLRFSPRDNGQAEKDAGNYILYVALFFLSYLSSVICFYESKVKKRTHTHVLMQYIFDTS